MSWSWAALMPHPPIIVPEVGRGREQVAAATLEGVAQLMKKLAERRPDRLLLLSPHQPYSMGALFVNGAACPKGTLAAFGVPPADVTAVSFDLKTPAEKELLDHLTQKGRKVRVGEASDLTRDQGALVPLYFLRNAWSALSSEGLPPVLLASPIGLDPLSAFELGEALASFNDGSAWGLLASGDLSHRLTRDSPSGYSSAGRKFDDAVVEALSSTDPQPLLSFSPEEAESAGECGLRSVMAMLGLCRGLGKTIDVLSYEGPFGVGYCNAISVF
jgi:aromatic ring-opening dioxygenase LigB subunit